jgi:hypothetical protein
MSPTLADSTRRRCALIGATLFVLAGAATTQAASTDAAKPATPEASIPFANRGGIFDWHADKDRGLWVQDVHRNWYYAKFMGPCIGLDFANSIGFDTRPLGNFDRFSSVFVPGTGRCTVQSFTVSESPYPKKDHKS